MGIYDEEIELLKTIAAELDNLGYWEKIYDIHGEALLTKKRLKSSLSRAVEDCETVLDRLKGLQIYDKDHKRARGLKGE